MSQGVANPAYEPSAPAGEYPESGEAVNRNVSISYPSSSQYPTLAESSKQYPSVAPNPNVVAPATPSSTRYDAKADSDALLESKPSGSCCWSGNCCQWTFIVLSFLGIIASVTMLLGGFDLIFNAVLKSKMEVAEGTLSYNLWKNTPVPMKISFNLYELVNPEEYTKKGAKPVVRERGPYVYNEYHLKQNLTFHDWNKTVSFYQQRWWTFDAEASEKNGTKNLENDTITILNTVPVSAANFIKDQPALLKLFGGAIMYLPEGPEPIVTTATAREILFDGYHDPLLAYVANNTAAASMLGLLGNLEMFGVPSFLPPGFEMYDKMAWFYKRNMSTTFDGYFNMFTGQDTLTKLGVLDWMNKNRNGGFYDEPCGHVNGSAGELWPPNQNKSSISLYNTDLCSTLKLTFTEEVTAAHDIPAYRYAFTNETFAYPPSKPSGQCFCKDSNATLCPLQGLVDVSKCRMGAPAFVSLPRFLLADSSLLNAVDGIPEPSFDDNLMYLDMIPELGIPVSVRARMQINMRTRPYAEVPLLNNIKDVILPIIWFEVQADLTDDLASQLAPVVWILNNKFVLTIVFSCMVGVSTILFMGLVGRRCMCV